jgi:hypothetical protein
VVATSRLGVDSEDNEEVAAHNSLEHGLPWGRAVPLMSSSSLRPR